MKEERKTWGKDDKGQRIQKEASRKKKRGLTHFQHSPLHPDFQTGGRFRIRSQKGEVAKERTGRVNTEEAVI